MVLSNVKIRYYIDPQTEAPHIHGHNVAESEVGEVLEIRVRTGRAARDLESQVVALLRDAF